jgi:probable phosphoglycerate mutase
MIRLLALRHGQSVWNAEGRWQGWADPPLSRLGESQAALAAERLAEQGASFGRVVSSDLRRAHRTAEIMADILSIPGPLSALEGFREYDVGSWSGLRRADIAARWPEELAGWERGELRATPGGEDRDQFDERVVVAIGQLLAGLGEGREDRRSHRGTPGRTVRDRRPQRSEAPVLLVTHGGVVRALRRRFGGSDRPARHLTGSWVEAATGTVRLTDSVDLLDGLPSEERPSTPAEAP